MNWPNLTIAVMVILSLLAWGCDDRAQSNEENEESAQLPEGFPEFYQRFHSDVEYQLAHIAFPIPEKEIVEDSTGIIDSTTVWTEDNWVLHRQFMQDGNYTVEYNVYSPEMVVETIRHKTSPVAMQRRFAKMSDGWNLIYYREMHVIGEN